MCENDIVTINTSKNASKTKEYIWLFGISILLFVIYLMNLSKNIHISIIPDEFGYWSNAAYFNGVNWSDSLPNFYYSYGYSLLLTPLFWIFDKPEFMYKSAVILNAILLCLCFIVQYSVIKKIKPNVDIFFGILTSFLLSVYPSYLAYVNTSMPECLLVFLFWSITWLLLGLKENTRLINFSLIGFLSFYMYIVHNRALGIFLAVIIVIICMRLYKRISFLQFATFTLTILILLILHSFINENLFRNLWLTNHEKLVNTYGNEFDKLIFLSIFQGIINFFKVFIGQLTYLSISTFLIFYFGFYYIINLLYNNIKNSTIASNLSFENNLNNFFVSLFWFISTILTLGIASVFFIVPNFYDNIIYGRYIEILIGPIVLVGLIRINNMKEQKFEFFISVITIFVLLNITSFISILTSDLLESRRIHSLALLINDPPYLINIYGTILGIIGFINLFNIYNSKNLKFWIPRIVSIIIIYVLVGNFNSSFFVYHKDFKNLQKYADIIIQSNSNVYLSFKKYSTPTYLFLDKYHQRDSFKCFIQFLFGHKIVKNINYNQIKTLPKEHFLIIIAEQDFKLKYDNYKLLEKFESINIYKKSNISQ